MKSLTAIVSEYFPEEVIEKDTKVFLKSTSRLRTGKEINGFYNSGNLKIPFIESDKKYYFDIRPIYLSLKPWLPQLKKPMSLVYSIILTIIWFYIVGGIFLGSGIGFRVIMLIFFSVLFFIIIKFIRTEINILAIKKEWVIEKSERGKWSIIKWSLPENEAGYSILHQLSEARQKKFPNFLKYQSGLWATGAIPFMKKLSPVSFKENSFFFSEF